MQYDKGDAGNILLWLWMLLVIGTAQVATAQTQTAVIEGRVVEATTGKPLAGANVFVQSTSVVTTTNKDGYFSLPPLPYGTYPISVFYEGLKSTSRLVDANQSAIRLTFSLEVLEETLQTVEVTRQAEEANRLQRLNAVEGTAIYEAKKSEVIIIEGVTANLATGNSRQIYSKVPGLNIWESDGAGLQLGIGGRGLSPDRTSNFNTRQNGYDISADALGYPENYYTPPLEGVEKIQLVRGAASLQYGTQFGGMLNFVMKKGPADKPFEFTSRQTIGSFGLFNTFNSIGGTKGKVNYYGFYQYKRGDGWRPNSGFEAHTAFADLNMQLTEKFFLCLEYTHMNYLAQQPGGLKDPQFAADPRQAFNDRNWFKVNWNLMAILMEYKFSNSTKLEMKNFGLVASRNSIGDLNRVAEAYPEDQPRTLFSDQFRNVGSELRLLHHYYISDQPAVLLVGSRVYKGFTRKKQGDGVNGKGADFRFMQSDTIAANHRFPNYNVAVFAEHIFNITPKLSITPGLRYEWITTKAEGLFVDGSKFKQEPNGELVPIKITEGDTLERSRQVFLAGIGASYKLRDDVELYSNFSRNYRAINFTDLRTININEKVDPNLSDESGFNLDAGIRGSNSKINYDISAFYLLYRDKIGFLDKTAPVTGYQRLRMNIGDARTYGLEAMVQTDLIQWLLPSPTFSIDAFINVGALQGKYFRSKENAVVGNKLELVPDINLKTGLEFKKKSLSVAYQFTYLSEQFTDATNAVDRSGSNAMIGTIPAFYVMDLSASYKIGKYFKLEGGVNNLSNNMYFTRRATAYPGPGIIPSDGRNFYLSVQFKY